jgi:hypothetical protein
VTALAALPLTHHDILALVGPFSRRGRHVDLAASQRDERRLVFKPPADEAAAADAPRETLLLECLDGGRHRLTRTLRRADGIEARLRAVGADLEAMLAGIVAVPAERHFVAGPGFVIARSYALDGTGPAATLSLTQGQVHVQGVVLTLALPAVRRVAADLTLEPAAGDKLALPEDLLAVLGWNWARLVPIKEGWSSKLRLRGDLGQRTRGAEAALETAAAHLARTLGEPPARYHERLAAARRGVFLRRGIPTFTALLLFGGVGLLSQFMPDLPMGAWVAMYHVPTVIVAVAFVLQELPRFEIPPWPRPLQGADWRRAPARARPPAAAGSAAP